jgi:hypothetical protein
MCIATAMAKIQYLSISLTKKLGLSAQTTFFGGDNILYLLISIPLEFDCKACLI